MRMFLEGPVKKGRKVQLLEARDGRLYLFRISVNQGEVCYFERLPKADLCVWEEALSRGNRDEQGNMK